MNADAGIDIEGPFTWATRLFGMVLGLVWGVSHAVLCFYCVYWKLYLCFGGVTDLLRMLRRIDIHIW